MTDHDTTFGLCTTGNMQALTACLSSVLLGNTLPKHIHLVFDGAHPTFGDFYLEQLATLAAVQGSTFTIDYRGKKGVRSSRDFLLESCVTPYLWMGDDDCIYRPECLTELLWAVSHLRSEFSGRTEDPNTPMRIGYINGSKPDLCNRRGYGDFSTEELPTAGLENGASMNQFYSNDRTVVRTNTMDTGNVLLCAREIVNSPARFTAFDQGFNSGGEDTLMGMNCNHHGLLGFFCPTAKALHLEKPNARFDEFAARGEMLIRAAEQLGIPTDPVTSEFMPFLKPKTYRKDPV